MEKHLTQNASDCWFTKISTAIKAQCLKMKLSFTFLSIVIKKILLVLFLWDPKIFLVL